MLSGEILYIKNFSGLISTFQTFQTLMNVRLVQFVTQMLHVQIHLVRLIVRVIKDLLVME